MAVISLTLLNHFLGWNAATIHSQFGDLPSSLPGWHFPTVTLEKLRAVIGPACTIAALGAIESLPMKVLFRSGLVDKIGLENFCANLDEALRLCRENPDSAAGATEAGAASEELL